MRRELLVATHNQGKINELSAMLADLDVAWVGLDDVGLAMEVAETGETLADNATLKATGYATAAGRLTLADDSGLEVDALGGAPGVLTARFGGPGLSIPERYRLLLQKLDGVPPEERTARFRCVVALAGPDGTLLGTAEGVCEGRIADAPQGTGGFGYDPVFYLPERGGTMAALPAEVKRQISHRARAMAAIAPLLRQVVGATDK